MSLKIRPKRSSENKKRQQVFIPVVFFLAPIFLLLIDEKYDILVIKGDVMYE